jgi:tetratricopeptide (TPR) repeat protein
MCRTGFALTVLIFSAAGAGADTLADCTQRGNAELQLRSCSEVVRDPAVEIDVKARAYHSLGRARSDAGAGIQAVADFTEAIRLRPGEPTGYAGRGRARLLVRDIDGAIADFSEALRLGPVMASLYISRGHALFVNGDLPAAIADFTEAIHLDPKSASAFNRRGLAHRHAGNLTHAIGDYTAAIALNPIYALAYNNRAYVYEALDRKDDAIADFQSALLLDSSLVGARDGLRRLGFPEVWLAETQRRIGQGRALVERNCAGCHATGQTGKSPNIKAPEFRSLHARHSNLALREPLSRGIAAPHDEMPRFALSGPEIDNIVAYINDLSPVAAGRREGRSPTSATEPIDADEPRQRVP